MSAYGTPQVKSPDWARIQRANAPRLAGMVPALNAPVESANVILNKQIATLNRAGSNPGNPILAGLGVRIQIAMGVADALLALYLYQDQGVLGANLVAQASPAGQYATFDFRAGSGRTLAGTSSTGSVKNFVRFQTEGGAVEREFWIKNYDADVVTLNSQAALDSGTLLPVTIPLTIVDAGRDWIDVNIDFMPSWNDEFQALALAGGQQAEAGFRKPYGGALFVSFFDKTPGTEGVGVQVNPIVQDLIYSRRSIQVQNTAGLKEITVRFRSAMDSSFVVDVPIKFLVTAPPAEPCDPPFSEACSSVYLKAGTLLPADCPAVASVPGVQVVAGTPGSTIAQDLLVITLHGTSVTISPKLRVRFEKWVANAKALAGADLEPIGSDQDYLPLILSGTTPVEPPPYGSPHRLVIAFSVLQLKADLVAMLNIVVIDGDHVSSPIPVPGPRARDIGLLPIGGTGGTGDDLCAY